MATVLIGQMYHMCVRMVCAAFEISSTYVRAFSAVTSSA